MTPRRHIVFLLNLMQDVNMVRPLAYLAARDLDVSIAFLVTAKFLERDILRIWQKEVAEIASDLNASVHIYESALDAVAILQGKHGIVISASESNLPAHTETHDVLRAAPPGFLKITLQHGYECVGFLQNREHVIAHGRNIKFAADVICGWCDAAALTSLAASERPKLYVSGPSLVLNTVKPGSNAKVSGGLICENLHSVRMRATGDFGKSFMDNFSQFCAQAAEFGQNVNLRPHPGGMYVVKNNIALPRNVTLDTLPIYKVDLSAYSFGVSAPSTVVLDMVFAGIPVAVWRDSEGLMDASNYEGLTPISTIEDWFAFARDATMRRDDILARQQRFVHRLAMPVDANEVYRRFATLLANGTTSLGEVRSPDATVAPAEARRILFLANGPSRTLQRYFLDPLAPLFEQHRLDHTVITEAQVYEALQSEPVGVRDSRSARASFVENQFLTRIAAFAPDVIVCCRYSGPATNAIANWAEANGVALIYHSDTDLLNIPAEIGRAEDAAFNQPARLKAIDTLLKRANLICCATPQLRQRLRHLGYDTAMVAGSMIAAATLAAPAELRPVRRIGFMDHHHGVDLGPLIDDLARLLRRNPDLTLDLMLPPGGPKILSEFGNRITRLDPPSNLHEAVAIMAGRAWDIGLCPGAGTQKGLADPVKWLDYSCAGAAVLAPAGSAYEAPCSNDCGILLQDAQWLGAIEALIDDPGRRMQLVRNAQARIVAEHDAARMQAEILSTFRKAQILRQEAGSDNWPHVPPGQLLFGTRPAVEKFR